MSEKKVIFKSFLVPCIVNNSNVGNKFIKKYCRYLDKSKCVNLKVTDIVDGQDIINSFADSCDINVIVKTMSVDTYNKLVAELKNAVQFVDMSKIPKNIFEMQNFKFDMHNKFDSLPLDLKEKFHNNYYEFIDSIEKGNVNLIVDQYFKDLHNLNKNKDFNKNSDNEVNNEK